MAVRTASVPRNLLAPLPFLLAGCLPFWAGGLLGSVSGYPLRPGVLLAGTLALAALILAAFASREVFASGAGRCPTWGLTVSGEAARRLAYLFLGVAALLGLILQFTWRTGDLTIPLGALGVLGGYFSFAPPLSWHRRGLGEVAGALCFGLLPVVTGFYLQSGYWVAEEFFYAVPLTFTGFNLFLIYGVPAPEGEPQERRSLAARVGPAPAALIYTAGNIVVILLLVALLFFPASPLPFRALLWLALLLAAVNQELLKRRAYRDEARLRPLCRLSLALHLGLGVIFNLMLWQRL